MKLIVSVLVVIFSVVFGVEFGIRISRLRSNPGGLDEQTRVEIELTSEDIPRLLTSQDELGHELSRLLQTLMTNPEISERDRTELLSIHLTIGIDRTLRELNPWLQQRGYELKDSSRMLVDEIKRQWRILQRRFCSLGNDAEP